MPLPLIPLLLGGAAVVGGALGVGGALSGKEKLDQAKKRIDAAREEYEKKKRKLDNQQSRTVKTLDKLGKQKLETQKSFQRFADAFEKIKNRPEFRTGREEHYVFAQHELQSLREISLSAVETIAGIGASVTAGTATAAGAYALVGVLGTASTGTAISGLAGAAATKATLAWFGGGSLASGGLGIAAGTWVLGGIVVAPALLLTGFMLDSKGDKALEQACEAEQEAEKVIGKIDEGLTLLRKLERLGDRFWSELRKTQRLYEDKVTRLEALILGKNDYTLFDDEEKLLLDNNIMLVKLLKDMTLVDLMEKNGEEDKVRETEVLELLDYAQECRLELSA